MIKEAIQKIQGLVESGAVIRHETIDGRIYTNQTLKAVDPPLTDALHLHSLDGMVDIINSSEYTARGKELLIQVQDYNQVFLFDKVVESSKVRPLIASSKFADSVFPFNDWLDLEHFIIAMHSHIAVKKDFEKVANFAMNISHEQKAGFEDDGVSQKVRTKKGVISTTEQTVPNPVTLTPYRTFSEIDQPSSIFVFRVKASPVQDQAPRCILLEADGGAWKSDARRKIYDYFSNNPRLAGSGISVVA